VEKFAKKTKHSHIVKKVKVAQKAHKSKMPKATKAKLVQLEKSALKDFTGLIDKLVHILSIK
jgi:hypothetical protein